MVKSAAQPPSFEPPDWPPHSLWPLDQIIPYPQNPRTHPREQIMLLAEQLRRWGPDQPIVVDEAGVILKGHGRLAAAREAGLVEFPVVQRTDLPESEKKALRLADNQIALLSGYDSKLMMEELSDLKLDGFNIPLLGFSEAELGKWNIDINASGLTDPETAPETPPHAIVKRGDLWTLGAHRLLCGDSTNLKDVAAVFVETDKAVLMNTDPPYGVNYGGIRDSIRASGRGGKKYADIENDELDGVALQSFLEAVIRASLPHLIENPAFYLWHPMLTQGTFFAAAAAADILIHRQIIWVKPSLILGRGDYHWRHELCFYGWIRGKRCAWLGDRAQDTIWSVDREVDKIHPTQKPTELFCRPIHNHTKVGDVIYEPFSGSGSQIIAAEMTGRRCRAIEIDASYVQVGIERWQQFTGKEATLDGVPFSEIKRKKTNKKEPRPKPEPSPQRDRLANHAAK